MTEVRNAYRQDFRKNFEESMKNWFLKTNRIFETQTNATVSGVNFGLKSILREVRPTANANLILSYDYEISLNGKSMIPQVEKCDIPDYTSDVEESVIMQEEYFAGFMELFKEKIPLNLLLTQRNFPKDLPFELIAKDFLHIVFNVEKLPDDQPLTVSCKWGEGLPMVNITVAGLQGNIPLQCTLRTDSAVPKDLLSFKFTI